MPSYIKKPEEIARIREGGKLLNAILRKTANLVKPGVSTYELDKFAEEEVLRIGGKPAFKGFGPKDNPFPATLCTSVNYQVVHGIPSKNILLDEGDIIGLDIGMQYKGLYTDTAITVSVGKISADAQKLIDVTREALARALKEARPGNKMGDIGFAVQSFVEAQGFGVVRDLVGHGVGYGVHEDPQVPNFGKPHTGLALEPGMVLAIEPMVTIGSHEVIFEDDQWTISTADGSLAAHFEHTVAITKKGCEILT